MFLYRWHAAGLFRRHRSEELLAEAEKLANAQRNLRQRLICRSIAAAGYARIGRFHIARELCQGGTDYSIFIVATQILANTYETQRFINQRGATPFVTTKAMLKWSFLCQNMDWASSPDQWSFD